MKFVLKKNADQFAQTLNDARTYKLEKKEQIDRLKTLIRIDCLWALSRSLFLTKNIFETAFSLSANVSLYMF